MSASPTTLAITLGALVAASADAATVMQVRDGPGGDGPGDLAYFLPGTGQLDKLRLSIAGHAGGAFRTYDTGTFDFEIREGTSGEFAPFRTYCVNPAFDLGFAAGSSTVIDYKRITPLSSDPRFSATTAANIETLWHHAGPLAQTSPLNAAAFQLLLWEMSIDGDSFNLQAGAFRMSFEVGKFDDEVRLLALSWYSKIGHEWTERTPLGILVNSTWQNLFIESYAVIIPLPHAGLLTGAGLLALAPRRRRPLGLICPVLGPAPRCA